MYMTINFNLTKGNFIVKSLEWVVLFMFVQLYLVFILSCPIKLYYKYIYDRIFYTVKILGVSSVPIRHIFSICHNLGDIVTVNL